jgi:hypothetical protein
MKLKNISLSLAVLATLAMSANAENSLSHALKNGTFKGQLKAVYYDVDKAAGGEESILSLGVMLNYITGKFYGFSAGFRAKSSNSPWATTKEKNFYKGDLYGSGAVLEEAYLKYQYKKSSLKIGRQYIKTPLLAGNGSRIVHESFEGYTATTKELPKTKIFVGYVDRYLTRTNFKGANGGSIGGFNKKIFMYGAKYKYALGDGIWTALVQNQSIKGLKLTGQYLRIKNATIAKTGKSQGDISVTLAQAEYKLKLNGLGLLAGIQYGSSNVNKDNSASGNLVGFKLGTKYKALMANVGYTISNSSKSMLSGVGISSNWAYAGDIIGLENYQKDVDALSLNLKYHFAKNMVVLGRYTDYLVGSNATLNGGNNLNAYDFITAYKFKGALKGLGAKFHFEDVRLNTGAVKNYRLYLTYNF